MVKVAAQHAQLLGEHDADARVAGPLALPDGFLVGHPGGWVGVLGGASLPVLRDLVDAASRTRAGLEREPDPLCLQASGNPAVLAGCFRCCDRGCCVVNLVLTAGLAMLGKSATLQ